MQKRQASESAQRTKLMEEPRQTGTLCTSQLRALLGQYEVKFAAVRSQKERCRNELDRVLATLGRLEEIQIRGVVYCGSSCIIIMLCTSKA